MITNNKLFINIALICSIILTLQLVLAFDVKAYSFLECDGNGQSRSCAYVACRSDADCGNNQFTGGQYCRGSDIYQNYITYKCSNARSVYAHCTSSTTYTRQRTCDQNQICRSGACYSTLDCTSNAYKKCDGNSVYWYNSCGNQQSLVQTCSYGQTCSNSTCVNAGTIGSNTSTNSGTFQGSSSTYAIKTCLGNTVWRHDYSGNYYQDCSLTNQACSGGQCVAKPPAYSRTYSYGGTVKQATVVESIASITQSVYVKNYRTSCYDNDIYWYDSSKNLQYMFKECSDDNQCTVDQCKDNGCFNTLICDGSTCVKDSDDYKKYCEKEDTTIVNANQENTENQQNESATAAVVEGFSLSKFSKDFYIFGIIMAVILILLFFVIFRRLSAQ